MTRNECHKLSMRDRMPAKKNSDRLDLLEVCKSKLKTRYPKGFDIEKANHKARQESEYVRCKQLLRYLRMQHI